MMSNSVKITCPEFFLGCNENKVQNLAKVHIIII